MNVHGPKVGALCITQTFTDVKGDSDNGIGAACDFDTARSLTDSSPRQKGKSSFLIRSVAKG